MAGAGGRRAEPSHLVVGHLARVHGTRGEMFVWPLTDRAGEVFAEGASVVLGDTRAELDEDAEVLEVVRSRPFKRGLLVSFRGYPDRTSVEPLAGRYALVERETAPEPGEDEWYYHQLLGLRVETLAGEEAGRVLEVYDTEPAHLLEVEAADGTRHLVPLAKRIVKRVDLDAGVMVIDPPEGLLEL